MKEYDIFLKKRLTEGSIIVHSLPFRDSVSAVNRVVLQAMLSYFSLQKGIAVANQSALLADVDEMLATVSEKINDQACLDANAALTVKYRNELEQAASVIGIDQTSPELLYRYTTGMEAVFSIVASIGETEFHYSLGDGSNEIGLSTSNPETIAEKKLQINNAIEMFYSLVVSTVEMFSVSNDTEILTTLDAEMKRYRLLSELDDMTLAEIDDMTLHELDFITIGSGGEYIDGSCFATVGQPENYRGFLYQTATLLADSYLYA